jgi:hypothetical protein
MAVALTLRSTLAVVLAFTSACGAGALIARPALPGPAMSLPVLLVAVVVLAVGFFALVGAAWLCADYQTRAAAAAGGES